MIIFDDNIVKLRILECVKEAGLLLDRLTDWCLCCVNRRRIDRRRRRRRSRRRIRRIPSAADHEPPDGSDGSAQRPGNAAVLGRRIASAQHRMVPRRRADHHRLVVHVERLQEPPHPATGRRPLLPESGAQSQGERRRQLLVSGAQRRRSGPFAQRNARHCL